MHLFLKLFMQMQYFFTNFVWLSLYKERIPSFWHLSASKKWIENDTVSNFNDLKRTLIEHKSVEEKGRFEKYIYVQMTFAFQNLPSKNPN